MNDLGLGVVVSMKDAFSRNAHRIQSSMQSLDASVALASERMTRNLDRIQKGTMLIGAGLAALALPAGLVASTAASQKALGELASVGVRDLRAIEDAAESFTNQWAGTRKAEFIGATYDVKSALSSLSDEAVGVFTSMAALTAKATKATTQEMVGTFTTGYGIFKPLMQDMTDMEWATAFSGAMAQTVASFKTNGQQMADAIKGIGAVAASANIPLQEQLAVLGQLQTTMPGAEAGTLYKSFMMKAAEAGKELGLAFTDSAGRLRSAPEILREIQSLYPDLSQAAAQVELKKAFGSDEALKFVLQMSAGMETLEGNIASIHQAMKGGTAVTEAMARTMNLDIGVRVLLLRQQVANLSEILGRTLLPVVAPIFEGLSLMVLALQNVARSIPGVTRAALTFAGALGAVLVSAGAVMSAIGLIGLAAPAFTAGIAAIGTTAAGLGAAIAAGFWPVTLAIGGILASVYLLRSAWTSNFGGIRDVVTGLWTRVSLVFQGIRALVGSLSGGVGQMSAELARNLESAGLLGFVVTVFRVYHRVREFLAGMGEAFSLAFGSIRAILEPAARSLMGAFGMLLKAFFPLLEVLGLVSTAADGSAFQNFGKGIGMVLGVVAQLGAIIIRLVVIPLGLVIRTLALVVGAATWAGKVIVGSLILATRFVTRFLLPVRMLGQAFVAAGSIIYSVWRILMGDLSLLNGLRAIGGAVLEFLITPFRWARDVVGTVWGFIRDTFGTIGDFFISAATQITEAIFGLPIIATLQEMLAGIRDLFAGDTIFFEAGKHLMTTLGDGIVAAAAYPYQKVKDAVGGIRDLLPFSDAREGPLSNLTASGAAMLRTFAEGMSGAAELPRMVFAGAMGGLQSLWGGVNDRAQQAASAMRELAGGLVMPHLNASLEIGAQGPNEGWWAGTKAAVARGVQAMQEHIPGMNVPMAVESAGLPPPPLAQRVLDGILNLTPKLDMQLVPRILSATLLLTPVLAAALPEPAAVVNQIATPAAVYPLQTIMTGVAGELPAMPGAMMPPPAPMPVAGMINPVLPAGMTTDILGRLQYAVPESLNIPLKGKLAANLPQDLSLSVATQIEPPLLDSVSITPTVAPLGPLAASVHLAVNPPTLEAVTIPASLVVGEPTIPAVELPAEPAAFPEPARMAAFQQPAAPNERLTLLREPQPPAGQTAGEPEDVIRPLLEALMSKLDTLAERPIEVTVTTTLDGRRIAEAVYKDMREQRVRNYETL